MTEAIAIIPASELHAMRQEISEIKGLLISLRQPAETIHPLEPCTVKWIEERCSVGSRTILNRIKEMNIPKLTENPVTIHYKYVAKLKLKGYKG